MGLLRGETLCEAQMPVERAFEFYCFLSERHLAAATWLITPKAFANFSPAVGA